MLCQVRHEELRYLTAIEDAQRVQRVPSSAAEPWQSACAELSDWLYVRPQLVDDGGIQFGASQHGPVEVFVAVASKKALKTKRSKPLRMK